jgi:hypothetical protein
MQALPINVMIYGLPILFGWILFNFLFAIIGDSFTEVKADFQDSPTLFDDCVRLARCSRKKATSKRIFALMQHIEEAEEQKRRPREMSNYLTGLHAKKWVHFGKRRMGPEELWEHIGYSTEKSKSRD